MLNDRNHNIAKSGDWIAKGICVVLMLLLLMGITVPCIPQDKVDAPSLTIDNKANLYDIDSTGTDIAFVLEALARRSGVNVVVSPEVKGQVSAHLKQMTIDAILQYLSTVQGFGWKKVDDTYLVAAKEKFAPLAVPPAPPVPVEQQVLVWVCKSIKPSDVPAMIEKLFPSVKVVEGPEAASPAMTATDTGLSTASKTQLSAGNSSASTTEKKSDKVVLYGSKQDIEMAKDLLSQVDVPRKQVSIEVAIMEVRSSAGKELGIDWGWNTYSISDAPTKDIFRQADPATGKVDQQELNAPWTGGIGFGRFLKSPTNITATVSAMIKDGSANLLAKPNISVLDGESGGILIGSKVKYPVLSQRDSDGRPIYDTQEEPIGISLQLSAKVGDEDKVVMALYPQVSTLTGYLNDLPQISTREARTTVAVKNGETLAIGGLISEEEIRNASKVPLLGDLPILGNFFKSVKKSKDRTEIVIFLTPKIES